MARRKGKGSSSLRVKMTEDELQTEVVKLANAAGWLHHELCDWIYGMARFRMKKAPRKGRRWPKPGWPDLVLIQPWDDETEPRRMIVTELKSGTGQVRDTQRAFLKSFAAIPGIEVYVFRPRDLMNGDIEHVLTQGPIDHEPTKKELAKPFGKGYVPDYGIQMETEDGTK